MPVKKLEPCPGKKNCVCSQDSRKEYYIEPFAFTKNSGAESIEMMITLCRQNFNRCKVVKHEPQSAHLTFSSALMQFTDDMHFLADESTKLIHIRSASRIGYSDLGVNRKRVEKLRQLYNQAL